MVDLGREVVCEDWVYAAKNLVGHDNWEQGSACDNEPGARAVREVMSASIVSVPEGWAALFEIDLACGEHLERVGALTAVTIIGQVTRIQPCAVSRVYGNV